MKGSPQGRYTKEFREETVRLATYGHNRRISFKINKCKSGDKTAPEVDNKPSL